MAVSQQSNLTTATEYALLQFVVAQLLSRVATSTLVRVVACSNSGGLSAVGTVDVQPVINLIAGDDSAWPHGQLYRLPYVRAQGGANAIILDPKPGDIGLAVFASRDISAAKSAAGVAHIKAADPQAPGVNPGSARQFDMSDGLYVGGMLNGVPTQFVQFNDEGIRIHSPILVRVEAPEIELEADTSVTVTAPDIALDGDVTVSGTVVAQGDVTGAGISLQTHIHGGVTSGGASTAPPTP
jgi:phage baseplate assembly protein gpV